MLLVVAATARELVPLEDVHELVCGVGPVEAAATTARALQELRPSALLHVGIAGAGGLEPLALVLGSEALYCDALGPFVPARAVPDAALLERLRESFPEAPVLPIATSARVGGGAALEVEAMEGFAVLRAAELAGVPAVEARVISNDPAEADRSRWCFEDAFARLGELLPALAAAVKG